jgi:hypothetical protein
MIMNAGLQAFLSGIIDYAGLFPPASLPLDEALANYARYRQEPEAWMLGRFICPATRLKEVSDLLPGLSQPGSPALAISALGRGSDNRQKLMEGLADDLDSVASFLEQQGSRVTVDVFELRLPGDVTARADPSSLWQLLDEIDERIVGAGLGSMVCFCETATGSAWKTTISAVIAALSSRTGTVRMGFKLRCGGADAAAFPSVDQVAYVLHTCLQDDVAFKATAGLHHPFRRYDPGVQTRTHGFVNVFAAGVLGAFTDQATLRLILDDDDPSHFRFDDEGLSWGERHVSVKQIAAARRDRVLSFGSCSFNEPRDDLRAIGWL